MASGDDRKDMKSIFQVLTGAGTFGRVARGVSWTVIGYSAAQVLRLAVNLALTRLLFPEAFGLMALVQVFVTGLVMFSDVGLGQSVMQNKRGDDEDLLNTAWTIQVIRGFCLWAGTCLIALPLAHLYSEPSLAQLLPVAGLSLVIAGFNPTRIWSANRHLLLGRITALDLINQVIGAVVLIALAWMTNSVWALVIGGVVSSLTYLALTHVLLPGNGNRFRWEPAAVQDLVHFGKWLFLSTALGFVFAQGDRAVLGLYLSMEMLGIYNIGYFLASFPLLLGGAIVGRIFLPLYRERPPSASADNFDKVRRFRFLITSGLMAGLLLMAILGVYLVNLLYDPRYEAAGAIVVLIASAQITQVIGLTYDQSALAAGDSRRFFILIAVRALVHLAFFVIGLTIGGILGAIAGQALALIVIHPLIIWLARLHGVWDPLHDAIFATIGIVGAALALWLNWDAVMALGAAGSLKAAVSL